MGLGGQKLNSVHLSVMLSPPKPFDKIQPNLVCELLTLNGVCNSTFFWPHPLGCLGRVKRSYIIKRKRQSQFQRFLYQTLCVFSQIKDIKHIKWNFHSVAWVMPLGWDFEVLGGSNILAWGFAMAPHRLCILVLCL